MGSTWLVFTEPPNTRVRGLSLRAFAPLPANAIWMATQELATSSCQTETSGGQTIQTVLPLTHWPGRARCRRRRRRHEPVKQKLQKSIRQDATVQGETVICLDSGTFKQAFFVCEFALGPPVLLWTRWCCKRELTCRPCYKSCARNDVATQNLICKYCTY